MITAATKPAVFYWLKNTRSLAIHGIRFPMFTSLNQLADFSQKSFRPNTNQLLFWLAWLLLLSSVAKPVWVDELVELPIKGRDIILNIDLSGSMDDKLGGVKVAALKFVKQRKNDRIGLVVFGSSAYLYSPLTFDKNIIEDYLLTVQTRMAGKFTAIGNGIIIAVEHFQNSQQQGKPRALILLTDGINSDIIGNVDVEEATKVAKQQNVKIYTIGLGGRGESALKYIANQTGGLYFRAENTNALTQIYTKIDALEKNAEEEINYKVHKDLFFYPLSAFLLLLIVLMLRRR